LLSIGGCFAVYGCSMSDRIAAVLGSCTIERILRLTKSTAVSFAALSTIMSLNAARNGNPPRSSAAS